MDHDPAAHSPFSRVRPSRRAASASAILVEALSLAPLLFLAARTTMPLGISVPQLVFVPPLVLLVAVLALFNFQHVYRFLSTNLSSYSSIPIVKTLRPYIANVRHALEQVLGKASSFKFTFAHVLAMGVIIMLLAVYNAIQRGNELQEQRLKLELLREQKKKKKNE